MLALWCTGQPPAQGLGACPPSPTPLRRRDPRPERPVPLPARASSWASEGGSGRSSGGAREAVPQTRPHRTRQRDSEDVVASPMLAVPGASLRRTGCFLKFARYLGGLVLPGSRNCLLIA